MVSAIADDGLKSYWVHQSQILSSPQRTTRLRYLHTGVAQYSLPSKGPRLVSENGILQQHTGTVKSVHQQPRTATCNNPYSTWNPATYKLHPHSTKTFIQPKTPKFKTQTRKQQATCNTHPKQTQQIKPRTPQPVTQHNKQPGTCNK